MLVKLPFCDISQLDLNLTEPITFLETSKHAKLIIIRFLNFSINERVT